MMNNIEFMEGFFAAKPRKGKPDWIKATVDVDLDSAIAFLEKKKSDGEQKIQFEVRESKGGKFYAAIDHWTPDSGADSAPKLHAVSAPTNIAAEDIPF